MYDISEKGEKQFKRAPKTYLGTIYFNNAILFFTTGCPNTIEVLDGLCFNDKDGTFICDPIIQQTI